MYYKLKIFLPLISSAAALAAHLLIPDSPKYTQKSVPYFTDALIFTTTITAACAAVSLYKKKFGAKYAHKSSFYAAAVLLINIYNIVTLKLLLIPPIYFPSPDRILQVFVKDGLFLLKCLAYSTRLLVSGFILGLVTGLTTGILIGWSRRWSYWVSPLIKIIGPIPSTAWIPVALVVFATSFQASVFLIALAVWFPTTLLTSSGISNIQNSYFEVGSTLGANEFQKIYHCSARRDAEYFYWRFQRDVRVVPYPYDRGDDRREIRHRLVYKLAKGNYGVRQRIRGAYHHSGNVFAYDYRYV
jgi:NitT/TauT family transport system permease protein